MSNGIFPFVLWTPRMPNFFTTNHGYRVFFFPRLLHSLGSKCLSVCMHVITAEGLFVKFCITGFLGSLLRLFRVYWNQIILTTIWREILLTQHHVMLDGNLYVYVCSQFQFRPEKKLSRSGSRFTSRWTVPVALDYLSWHMVHWAAIWVDV